MKVTTGTIYNHELIGLDTKIVKSTNTELSCLSGSVVFETKNTLCVTPKKNNFTNLKTIPKKGTVWQFSLPDSELSENKGSNTIEIDGANILKRPQDRVTASVPRKEMKK